MRSNALTTHTYLLKRLKDFLSLTEVPEEQLKRSRHQRRIIVHC